MNIIFKVHLHNYHANMANISSGVAIKVLDELTKREEMGASAA